MYRKNFMGVLMAPAGTAGSGGGGTGAGGGEGVPLTLEIVMAEVNKSVTGQIKAQLDSFKKDVLGPEIETKLQPVTTGLQSIQEAIGKLTPQPPASGSGGGANVPPEINVQLKSLQETTKQQSQAIETLKKQKDEADQRAERSERHSTIRGALSNLHFISEQATHTAFGIVEPHIKRMDDGSLIGAIPNGDNFPVDAFVKDFLTKEHPYLLRASGASGSGAPAGGAGVRMGVKADMNDIKVNMKPETRESVVASIGAALANQ